MADNLASVWEQNILDNIMNSSSSTFPEVTQASYSRVTVGFGTAVSATGALSVASITGPTASVTFPQATASWGTISGYGLFKASSGSTGASQYLVYGAVSPTVAVTTNDTVSFAASAMTLTMG
jgi:hypothetical protein